MTAALSRAGHLDYCESTLAVREIGFECPAESAERVKAPNESWSLRRKNAEKQVDANRGAGLYVFIGNPIDRADSGGVSARSECPQELEALFPVLAREKREVDTGAVCRPRDAGASGVHSRAGRGQEICGCRAGAG